MDRRHFLAASSLAAVSPVLAQVPTTVATVARTDDLFGQVQFTWDGLGLNPREYATLLSETVAAPDFRGDNYSLGGSVAALEEKFAKLLGKEAAMFVPTGTLANHLAVRKLAGNDRRVLVQAESHLYNDSGDGAQTLSGLNLVPLAAGRTTFTLAEVEEWVARSAGGRVENRVGVISIESPVRRRDHSMFAFDEMQRISSYARANGIRMHLDGARMFNLPLHSGRSVQEHAALFDTVYVSAWKHFNGASGAILAGDAGFVEGMFHQRRMFGGALPHAWPQVALVPRFVDTYETDYAKAWRVADEVIALLQADGRFQARRIEGGTSRFMLKVTGVPPEFVERAYTRGLGLARADPDIGEMPMQVNPSLLRLPPAGIARLFVESADA